MLDFCASKMFYNGITLLKWMIWGVNPHYFGISLFETSISKVGFDSYPQVAGKLVSHQLWRWLGG